MKKFFATKVFDKKLKLGEGPVYDADSRTLYLVDIESRLVYKYNELTKKLKSIRLDKMVGCVLPAINGGIVAAATNSLIYISPDFKCQKVIKNFGFDKKIRFNDGKCDCYGRLWVGTMYSDQSLDGASGGGSLYRITPTECSTVVNSMSIPNGIAWSEDNSIFFHIDTPTNKISKYIFEPISGKIKKVSEPITIPKEDGCPDGMCIDSEGMLWIALWGGYKVVCYNPVNGERLASIDLPDANVSCCTFGGANLRDLYITTAMDDKEEGGHLYVAHTDVAGTKPYKFKL